MGPGRYGPILLQRGGAKVEGEQNMKTRLQAMRQVDKREKQPYYFHRENGSMKWKNENGELMYTYTILTTAVAPELKWLHTRDIKSFFGVKTEKEPKIASPVVPTKQEHVEKERSSSMATSSPVKKEEHDDFQPQTTPKKEFKQYPTKFVPASSFLTKHPDDDHNYSPQQSPNKRRRVSSPAKTKKPPAKSKPQGPKQSSLDFFFGKSSK
ncbi:unnamed protein product [Phytophthora lilii]|uniref:Unnamed protein product n=1 Tax=Phytophthora lilii TaxID=2077276 RepID=A0A9W6WSG0_9STRA|nr:unnamed protein product [Phytophthora lilii]